MLKSLSSVGFEQFLRMLAEDRDLAAEKYIELRERLERFFEWRNCENTEELTDIVFDRVTKKINDGEEIRNAEAFCVSVAKFVLMENRRDVLKNEELDENSRELSPESDQEDSSDGEMSDIRLKCLDKCLSEIPTDNRELLIKYFDTDEETMISTRKHLAKKIGINLNTLRIRVSRLKSKLAICAKTCCDKT